MEKARIVRADNEVRNVLFRANSIKNENGESIRRIIVINDITDTIEKVMRWKSLEWSSLLIYLMNLRHL